MFFEGEIMAGERKQQILDTLAKMLEAPKRENKCLKD